MKHSNNRLLELDVLRGLAALSVMCFHYTTKYTEFFSPTVPPLFKFPVGGYGVDLFFMISGFVIFMTLEKTERPLDFIVSRFSRLYPCYWAAVILTFTVIRIFHLPDRERAITSAIINMSMFQDWFGASRIDGAYWTLTVELSFYFLMLLLFTTRKLKHVELFCLAWLIVMVWINRFSGLMHLHIPRWINVTQLLTYGHLFIAGIFFYNLKTKGNKWYRHVALALCFIVQYITRTDTIGPIAVPVFFIIFYLFIFGKLSWIVNKPMVFLGSISYSMYLIHQNMGYVIIRYLYFFHANAYLRFFIPVIFSLLMATAITYTVEKPAMTFIREKYDIWKKGVPDK